MTTLPRTLSIVPFPKGRGRRASGAFGARRYEAILEDYFKPMARAYLSVPNPGIQRSHCCEAPDVPSIKAFSKVAAVRR
jgi:hypothetical protein